MCAVTSDWMTLADGQTQEGEYRIQTAHGTFYETFNPEMGRRRSWLLAAYGYDYKSFTFDEAVIYYAGPITDEEQIVATWIMSNDTENPQPVSGEPIA